MKKIFELGPSQFMTGIASGSQLQNTGLFIRAEGITTVRNPFLESDDFGILQASPAPTDLTGSEIVDAPIAWTLDPHDSDTGFPMLYLWGIDGNLYSIDMTGDANPVRISVVTGQGPAANGLFVMDHSDGTKRVYYFREADIGSYGNLNASPSFNTGTYTDDIEETIHHPVYRLFDRQYFGNGRYVGIVEDNLSGGLSIEPHALDLDPGMTITTFADDGHYLVIGATTNPPIQGGGIGSLPHGTTKILFWDTNSSSWEREWTINDSAVYAIRRVGSVMHALTGRGLYVFSIDTPPQMVLPFMDTRDAPSPQFPSHFTADVLGEALVWANAAGSVSSWGKFTPAMKNAYLKPFAGFGNFDLSLICASAKTDDLYVGSGAEELYRAKWSGDVNNNLTGVVAETIFVDLKRWYQIGRIVIEFAQPLNDEDAVGIGVQTDSAEDSFSEWGGASFSDHGRIVTREMYNSTEAHKLKLNIGFGGGAVRIRNIEVWGDPIERPTHQRV